MNLILHRRANSESLGIDKKNKTKRMKRGRLACRVRALLWVSDELEFGQERNDMREQEMKFISMDSGKREKKIKFICCSRALLNTEVRHSFFL